MKDEQRKAFLHGVGYAAAYLRREADEPTLAAGLLSTVGTLQDFVAAKLDVYDLVELKALWRSEPSWRAKGTARGKA